MVLPECGAKCAELLKAAGAPVAFNKYERVAHGSCGAQMEELKDWLKGVFKF